MTAGRGSGYDKMWTFRERPRVRRRIGRSTDRGRITKFLVKLEYYHDGEWHTVVHYDHNPGTHMGHDVTTEGLHVDIYSNGENIESPQISGPMPAAVAFTRAEEHLDENLERYVKDYERWHNLTDR